jgi:L-arabonate dehydrase
MCEALGLTLPGISAIPAVDSRKKMLAHMSGMRAVEMVKEDLTLSKILTKGAFENAIKVNAGVGGSTNLILHLLAIAHRIGVDLKLEDFDKHGSDVPLLLNLMPSGKYLMEEFYYAGGLPVVIKELESILRKDTITVNGKSIVQNSAGITVVKGNLCPDGAIIKTSASSDHLLRHTGKAVVFETIEDYHARIDDPELEIDENSIMVLKNVGPKGYPGMPEVGNMALPKKLLDKGITDLVRISDGRMSGTAYGTVFLHVSPESALGGPLALVQNGDVIKVDVHKKSLHLDISVAEMASRRAAWEAIDLGYNRGYVKLYIENVNQAHEGADFDFLKGKSGHEVKRESH